VLGLLLFGTWVVCTIAPTIRHGEACGPVRLVLSIYWMSLLLSYAVMNRHSMPANQLANSDRFLISMMVFSGLALLIAEGVQRMDDLMLLIRTLVAAIAVMCFIAVLQSRTSVNLALYMERLPFLSTKGLFGVLDRNGFNRPAGTATHPIEFGVTVGVGLALGIHVLCFDRTWRQSRRLLAFALIAVGIPLAISRSALLVAVVVLIMFWSGSPARTRRQILLGVASCLMVMFVAVPGLLGTLRGYIFAGQSDSSIATRTDDYAAVSGYLRNSPWIGRGPGSFIPSLRVLDNQYLMSLIETGLVGGVILLVLLTVPAWLGRSGRKLGESAAHRNLGQMFAGAGVGIAFAAATFDAFSFPMFTSVVALTIGFAGAYWRLSRAGDVLA